MTKLIGPIGAFLMVIAAPMAHASLQLTYQIDALTPVNCGIAANPNPTVICGNITAAPITITTLSADSTSPGAPTSAEEDSATVKISNPDSVAHTIVINVASNGFTAPGAPPTITFFSNIGGAVAIGSLANLLSFQSCLDTTNTLAGCPGTARTVPVTPNITAGPSNYSAGDSGSIATLPTPYSIDEVIRLTLGAGTSLNFSASTILNETPEPMSVALLGSVLVLTGAIIRRKRKQTSIA